VILRVALIPKVAYSSLQPVGAANLPQKFVYASSGREIAADFFAGGDSDPSGFRDLHTWTARLLHAQTVACADYARIPNQPTPDLLRA